jgi:hypothetical protein
MPSATPKKRRPRAPKNRFAAPLRAPDAAPIPDFAPVPRLYNRHDGWTPERQRAFIGALADTGCVDRAARMVNMAQTNCYTLRRAPGAEGFRKAWDAALDCGLQRLKDLAFTRAIEGELVPVFSAGKLVGHRRKHNNALLMFCLRHYGKDAGGKRTTINYFSSRASAQAGAEGEAGAGASTTTVQTVISGDGGPGQREEAHALLEGFAGVALDAEAQGAIMAALHECAARARKAQAALDAGGEAEADALEDDPAAPFVPQPEGALPWRGAIEPPVAFEVSDALEDEDEWAMLGAPLPDWAQDLP